MVSRSHKDETDAGSEPILGGANASLSQPRSFLGGSQLGGSRAASKVGSRAPSELRSGRAPSQLSKVLSAAGSALASGKPGYSKAQSAVSISPSDSPSQAPSKRAREAAAASQRDAEDDTESNQGTERAPTIVGHEAAGGGSQKPVSMLDVDDGDARKSAVGSIAASQRSGRIPPAKTHSQAPTSVISSHVPSVDASKMMRNQTMSPTHSHANRTRDMRSPSNKYSSAKYGKGDTIPTDSRAYSPDPDDLDDRETEIVKNYLQSRTPGNRSSMAPTVQTADLKHSHFHDQELCILLHAADNDMEHDVVKKAILKAAKARVKALGMKHDIGVSVYGFIGIIGCADCGCCRV